MVDPVSPALNVVVRVAKTLVFNKIQDYLKFKNSYEGNMKALQNELKDLHAKKQLVDDQVRKCRETMLLEMTKETKNWLESFKELMEKEEMKKLMKEERVAEIVVKMMEYSILKRFWKDDREVFNTVVDVLEKKLNPHQETSDGEVDDAADYKKVAKIAKNVINETVEEFTKFITRDDAAVLRKLTKDGDEMAMFLRKAKGIIRNKVGPSDDNEELDEEVQPVDTSIVEEKFGIWRKHIRSFNDFLDIEKFKKGLPKGAILGLQLMDVLISNTRSDLVEQNDMANSYCGCWLVPLEGFRYEHDMSERADTMVKAIKILIDRCPSGSLTRQKSVDEIELIPDESQESVDELQLIPDDFEGLESRKELLQKILIALQDDQVKAVGLFGMGGCGKTTLAKVVLKRVCDLFNKRVVVDVSEAPNIKAIQDQIAREINLPLNEIHGVAQRAHNLYYRLKSEKILIILDNVWKKLKLDEVGIPPESTKDFYCKLLITTREKHVCRDMNVKVDNIFEVGMLNEKETLNLFQNQIGAKVNNKEYKPVIDRLLRNCGGLPLAIVATSSALWGKKLPKWWEFAETLEKSISSQVSSEYCQIYSILETSYQLMDIKEKKIFFFIACLSPLDSAIAVDDLMRYGIGLDLFQHVDSLSEARAQASAWAYELISSSWLLKDDSHELVRIHDIVRTWAILFANKGMTLVESIPRWIRKDTFEKFTAISLMSGHDFSRLSGVKAPLLEILLLKGNVSSTTLTPDFFKGMTNLKVLSLSNIDFKLGLPESMTLLQRLQTLHLHHCKLKDIRLVGKLVNLLVLSLRGSSLEELAVEIGQLRNLLLLDMSGCNGMNSIPANILSRLSNLEGLYMINGFNDWTCANIEINDGGEYNQVSGSELDTLSHLDVLEMEVYKAEQLFTINIGDLAEQLGKFRIRVRSSYVSDMASVPDLFRYECDMADVSMFRYVLELRDIDESRKNWLRALLRKADYLLLIDCDRLTENLVPQLVEDDFLDLRYLDVESCDVRSIINSNEHDESMAFANLEFLRLANMKHLEMICYGKASSGRFYSLKRLSLFGLPKLVCGLPLNFYQLRLSEVSIRECSSLRFIVYWDSSVVEDPTSMVLPLLESLCVIEARSLLSVLGHQSEMSTVEHVPEDHPFFSANSSFPSFERLKLVGNKTVATLWSNMCRFSSFRNLKVVDIGYCTELQSLGSPSIFAALVQLEELKISNCDKLQVVISKEAEDDEIRDHVIVFPSLKYLVINLSCNFERFYGGNYKLYFPILKSLILSSNLNLINFDGPENSTTLFSDKIEFPCLEELQVTSVSDKGLRLWTWCSPGLPGTSESGSITLNPIPSLQKLCLESSQGLMSIPHFVSNNLSHLEVTNFSLNNCLFSSSLANKEVCWTYSQFPKLENLCVSWCLSLEDLFQDEDDDTAIRLCECLRGLKLNELSKLKMIPMHLLKNLRSLCVSHVGWKYLFSGDLFIRGRIQLMVLENLEVSACGNMEVVIMDDRVGNGEDQVYVFPRLKTLKLESLSITNFASKRTSMLSFPSLEEVELFCCSNMQYFLSGNMNDIVELSSLKTCMLADCSKLLSFSSLPLVAPKLHEVRILECPKLQWFARGDPIHDDTLDLRSLEMVSIEKCPDIQSFSAGGIRAPKLCDVKVDDKDFSRHANDELEDILTCLNLWTEREKEEDMNHNGDGETEERQTEGSERSQDEESTEGRGVGHE